MAWRMAKSFVDRPSVDQHLGMRGYETIEQLQAAKTALLAQMPDWELPAAYALGVSVNGSKIDWRVINHRGTHDFPAVVLSTVLGYRSGSATYRLDLATFDTAIEILEPAGACKFYDHPNLWAWQKLRLEIAEGQLVGEIEIFAVFIGKEHDCVVDDPNRQLRTELAIPTGL